MHIRPIDAPLYVVAVISNPARYKRRYELYHHFEKMVLDSGAKLVLVEAAQGERHYECIKDDPRVTYVPLQTESELWHKETMINLGVSRLPKDWKYVAWIDADVAFARPDWVYETLHQLQVYPIVQMFSEAVDLGPNYEMLKRHMGFGYAYIHGKDRGKDYEFWHPGYAWAMTRTAWNQLGGLLEGTLGGADIQMAYSLIGEVDSCLHAETPPKYREWIHEWQERAVHYLHHNLGYVAGTLLHHWHGKKRDRRYKERWQILIDHQFDPFTDLRRDWQGLYQLDWEKPLFRNDLRAYFRARNEDSIDKE